MDLYNHIQRRISRTDRKLPVAAIEILDAFISASLSVAHPYLAAGWVALVALCALKRK